MKKNSKQVSFLVMNSIPRRQILRTYGRNAYLVDRVHVNVGLQKCLHTGHVTSVGRPQQRSETVLVHCLERGAVVHQQVQHFQMAHVSGPQQCRHAALYDVCKKIKKGRLETILS